MFKAKNLFLFVLSLFLPFALVAKEVPRRKLLLFEAEELQPKRYGAHIY